ncbi:alsin [Anthonomus grandis grandis]|uniref:alsin n=1 Tax=Anthonomus grandis grandis TaxID=2921223 RepID=UPI002166ADB9|nr:alsin [Anthonomus grandis grandis]
MNHCNINLWICNKSIKLTNAFPKSVKKIANINNHLYLLTNDNDLYQGFVQTNENNEHFVQLYQVEQIKPLDIDSSNDCLYIVNSEGTGLACNEDLKVIKELTLCEPYQCSLGHNCQTYKIKIKRIVANDFGILYISENNQLWASGFMPHIGINSEVPQKIIFFSGREVHDICIGVDFAVALVSKRKVNHSESEDIFNDATPTCQVCSQKELSEHELCNNHNELCPLGVELKHSSSSEIDQEPSSNIKIEKNIIFRNTEAAKEFLTRQISRMSSAGEEYLIECTEKPTRIIKENMSNVASFVYEGVKTVGDKVATLSRHVSSSSEYASLIDNNNAQKHSREDLLLLSGSQSTSEQDLSEAEILENVDGIISRGMQLLNREVWMWGNVRLGCLGTPEAKNDLPVIISSLSNLGVTKVSLQNHHASAITLDGRMYLWGRNNHHQISIENNSDQITPKLFNSNMNERVLDVNCGSCFTAVLTSKINLTYFGKESEANHQNIYNRFMSETEENGKLLNNLVSSKEYLLLNLGQKYDDSFNNFLVKEQIMLEEMLCVNQYVIKILSKKSCESEFTNLLEALCKSYIDLIYCIAANVESLLAYCSNAIMINDIIIIKNFKEFLTIFKNYVNVVENVVSINGFLHISKLVPTSPHLYNLKSGILKEKDCTEKDISLVLLSPVKRTNVYTDFFKRHCLVELNQAKWKDFLEYIDLKSKEADKTSNFWLSNGKSLEHLIVPQRRLVCDSQNDTIVLQGSSRFSSHRFILFSDIFAHISGSSSILHTLTMIWIELPQHDTQHLITIKTPEDTLTLVATDAVTKNAWYHALQNSVKIALNKKDLLQAPLARSGSYTFCKSGFFKDATYSGRWLNTKMHGSGKLRWPDGRVYTGQFSNHCLCGYGIMEMPGVGTYEGEWKENKQHGYGTFTYSNKDIYKGYFKDGLPHGHGLLRKGNFMANSASLYIGEWSCGKKSGYGIMDDIASGEKYLGFWSDCKKEGRGMIVTSEGTYYEGNFHNDLLQGEGIMVLEDGTHYEGEFKGTGIVSGRGTFTLRSGHVIEGFLQGSMEEGIKIASGTFRKGQDSTPDLPKSFGQLCTPPSQKWKALFIHCHQVLGLNGDSTLETPRIWQNVAVYLSGATTLKKGKGDDNSLQNSLDHLDVIPPFGRDKITMDSYGEIKTYLNRAFESSYHPLGSLLNNLSEAYISSYSGRVHPILVNHAISEIIDITQRFYETIRYLFPGLPACDSECVLNDGQEKFEIVNYQCLLYPVILPKVYNSLCTLLSLKNESQEKRYKKVLIEWNKLSDRSLMAVLSVEKKFFNLDQVINLSDKSCAFVEAIETLQQIISVFLPIEKLTVIRNTVEHMTPVAQSLLGKTYSWNMDDLFPLFLFVVVRARIPHLGAELEFMEHFMDRNLDNGELGIMFTTLKACYQQILQDKSFV